MASESAVAPVASAGRQPDLAVRILLALSAVKLIIHVLTNHQYGYFIDELYYVACSEHLDWGYVDHPPLIALVTRVSRFILGDSLPALRFFPALAGAVTVFLAGVVARELGGGRYAQMLAGLAVLVSPLYLYNNTILSMNALDAVIWTLAVWLVLLIQRRGVGSESGGLWLLLGLVLGAGLENKISVLFLGFGLAVGILLTGEHRHLRTAWPWLSGAIALAIFLPHIFWQIRHGWPTLEFMHNASVYKNRSLSLLEILFAQTLEAHPLGFLLVLLGLGFAFFGGAKRYRLLGWMYLAVFAVVFFGNGKSYYLGAVYPVMWAVGAVAVEKLLDRSFRRASRTAVAVALGLTGAALAPVTLPVLPVETLVAYFKVLGGPPPSSEQKDVGPLPQHFADMFGNEELVALTAEVFRELPPEDQARAVIYGMAYPQAAAVDFFRSRYGLPGAISGHNAYWMWGPGNATGDVCIVLGLNTEILEDFFEDVQRARVFHHPYAMPWRNDLPIFVCRRAREPMETFWPRVKHYE